MAGDAGATNAREPRGILGFMTRDRLIEELEALAFSDVREILEPSPGNTGRRQFKPLSEWSERARRAVQSITVKSFPDGRCVVTGVKMYPRKRALALLRRLTKGATAKPDGSIPQPRATTAVHFRFYDE